MKVITAGLIFFLCLPLTAGINEGFFQVPGNSFSLFSPGNYELHHSYTFQSGVNSQGEGYYLNMLTNHLDLQLHPKLDIKFDLHFVNAGSMNINSQFNIEGNNDNNTRVVPEFEMEWRPNENMKISFGWQRFNERNIFWQQREDLFDD